MKGYVFTMGVDGFGEDTAPAHEFGVYLDFNKAFKKLVELNHEVIKKYDFYEEDGEDFYPETDKELDDAFEKDDWILFEKLMQKHIIKDEIEINKQFINEEPYCGMYALDEVEIFE